MEFVNALNLIEVSLLKWQKNQPRLKRLIEQSPKLHSIEAQVAELNDKTLTLVHQACSIVSQQQLN